jgi:hypothetical protein
MKLPYWATPSHPIARRELIVWRKGGLSLWWLWIIFLLPPLCGALGLFFSLLSAVFSFNSASAFNEVPAEFWAGITGGTLLTALWGMQAFLGWGLGLFVVIGSAGVIARERESQNWPLLRLTSFDVPDIVSAKMVAILRGLIRPLMALLILRVLSVVGTVVFVYILAAVTRNNDGQQLQAITVNAILFLPFFLLTALSGTLYTSALSTLVSSIVRTPAVALAMSFVTLLLLWLFAFLPIQYVAYTIIDRLAQALLPYWVSSQILIPIIIAGFALPAVMQIGVAALALGLSFERAGRLEE